MTKTCQRGKKIFANNLHQDLFFLVFYAAVLPCLISIISVFYLFFNISADQVGIPEAVAYNVIPAAMRALNVLILAAPLLVIFILFFAYKITHKLIGPYHRILRELDEVIDGSRRGPIIIRNKDKFQGLVEKINLLLEKQDLDAS